MANLTRVPSWVSAAAVIQFVVPERTIHVVSKLQFHGSTVNRTVHFESIAKKLVLGIVFSTVVAPTNSRSPTSNSMGPTILMGHI